MDRKRNPLGFLDELLEEEKMSNEHFGSVQFWKNYEFIDVTRLYNPRSIEYRNVKLIVYEAFFYMIGVLMLTLYINSYMGDGGMNLEARNQQERYWGGCEAKRGSCKIDDVKDGSTLLVFLQETIIPKLFTDQPEYYALTTSESTANSLYTLNSDSVPWLPRYCGDTKTIVMLGNTRVRQLRVQKNRGCNVRTEFAGLKIGKGGAVDETPIACYPPFSEEVESQLTYPAKHVPAIVKDFYTHSLDRSKAIEALNANSLSGSVKLPSIQNLMRNNASMTTMQGRHAVYPGEGFYFDLPLKRREAENVITELRSWDFLDKSTRAVIVENTVVNPNTNIIVSNRLLFEFNAFGTVSVRQDHVPIRATLLSMSLLATDEKVSFMFLVIFRAFFFLYFVAAVWFMYKNRLGYFFYAWNLLDVVIIVLFGIHLGVQFTTFTDVLSETQFLPEMLGMPEFFFSFSKLRAGLVASDGLLSVIGLLCWLRTLKFFTLLDRFRILTRTIERTFEDLAVFALLLATIIFGFSVAFWVGFYNREDVPEFQTFLSSMSTLFFMLAKGVKLEFLFENNHWLPQALYVTYLIVVYFLLVNMFMAIVNDTFTLVTYSARHQGRKSFAQDSVTWCFLISYAAKLKGEVFLGGDELDEDRGHLKEQFIEVSALPDVLQKAWEVKREQIRSLVQQKVETMGHTAEIQKLKAEFDDFDRKGVISRVQIQRLLDEDEILVHILSTNKAIDVIRRFSVPQFRNSNDDAFHEITTLQENVFSKLEEFDGGENKLEFGCIETLKLVSTGLQDAMSEIQNQWRNELTSVLESTNHLASYLDDDDSKNGKDPDESHVHCPRSWLAAGHRNQGGRQKQKGRRRLGGLVGEIAESCAKLFTARGEQRKAPLHLTILKQK
ncbi:unnamed protein product [Amoebophrya sp. A120]|nr:unnamed protein product [Amoebophrya sp. A120]|eukprot:GSA120T00003973001.1